MRRITRRHKLIAAVGLVVFSSAVFLAQSKPSSTVRLLGKTSELPTDPGRLSLLQVERQKGEFKLINQRNGSEASINAVSFVEGRTREGKPHLFP